MSLVITERPENITFEDIHQLLVISHKELAETKGLAMRAAAFDGNRLRNRVGPTGKTFVALDDGVLVGTVSIREIKRNSWYAHGKIAELISVGTLPEYRGKHIFTMLYKEALAYAKEKAYPLIELDTAEKNTNAIDVYQHLGFCLVDLKATKGSDHYSVVMAHWIGNASYSEALCKIIYWFRRQLVRLRYRVGGKKRFFI